MSCTTKAREWTTTFIALLSGEDSSGLGRGRERVR